MDSANLSASMSATRASAIRSASLRSSGCNARSSLSPVAPHGFSRLSRAASVGGGFRAVMTASSGSRGADLGTVAEVARSGTPREASPRSTADRSGHRRARSCRHRLGAGSWLRGPFARPPRSRSPSLQRRRRPGWQGRERHLIQKDLQESHELLADVIDDHLVDERFDCCLVGRGAHGMRWPNRVPPRDRVEGRRSRNPFTTWLRRTAGSEGLLSAGTKNDESTPRYRSSQTSPPASSAKPLYPRLGKSSDQVDWIGGRREWAACSRRTSSRSSGRSPAGVLTLSTMDDALDPMRLLARLKVTDFGWHTTTNVWQRANCRGKFWQISAATASADERRRPCSGKGSGPRTPPTRWDFSLCFGHPGWLDTLVKARRSRPRHLGAPTRSTANGKLEEGRSS